MKAHKEVPQHTLTKDDAELVAEKVQYHTMKVWYDAEKKREEIVKTLKEVNDTLEQLQLTTMLQKEQAQQQQTSQERKIP